MTWADDHWRDSYDAWKTRSPDDDYDGPTCERCGEWLRRWRCEWVCDICDEEEERLAYWDGMASGEPADEYDAEFLSGGLT